MAGTVFLVGAGPGDPDLITRRGYELLLHCDALVYDALVPPELVRRSRARTKIYAGKTAGGKALSQEEINALLVELAQRPGGPRRIVRLKGGDPFVFGRGGEEALACEAAGVPFEVIPGVTAGLAAPALAGVPVTHRGLSRGVTLLTGNLEDGTLDLPWKALVDSGTTLVFYMAVASLAHIVRALLEHGMGGDTPALVVQEGASPGMRIVYGSLEKIATMSDEQDIRPPAVVTIGPAAALYERLGGESARPLAGKTVILTRSADTDYPEAERLRTLGARLIDLPVIHAVPRSGDPETARLYSEVRPQDVMVFTSGIAASLYLDLVPLFRKEKVLPLAERPHYAAATLALRERILDLNPPVDEEAEESSSAFFQEVLAPASPGAEQVATLLQDTGIPQGTPVWLPRSAAADDELPRVLQAAGYLPRPILLYDVVPQAVPGDIVSLILSGRVDAVLFMSGTTVEALLQSVPGLPNRADLHILYACIGRKTAQVAASHGLECNVVPVRPVLVEYVDAVIEKLSKM